MALLTETCQRHVICQISPAAFAIRPGPHYLAMLQAYFDESGHPADSPVVNVATVVAPLENWCAFEDEWQAVLDRYQVRGLHMKHYAQFRGDFQGWTKDRQKEFILELLPILHRHAVFGFGCSLPMDDWKAVIADAFPHWNPLAVLFRCCLDALQLNPQLSQGEPIECWFEDNREIRGTISQAFDDWRDEFEQNERFRSFGFTKKGDIHALEAADLLAYEGRKEVCEGYVKQTGWRNRKLYQSIDASMKLHFWAITKEGLQSYLQAEFPEKGAAPPSESQGEPSAELRSHGFGRETL